jgi:DNA-binding response OmpR family regulator
MPNMHGARAPLDGAIVLGKLMFRPGDPCVAIDGRRVFFRAQELKLLQLLVHHAGRFVSVATVAQHMARGDKPLTPTGVAVVVHRLRARLAHANVHIRTLRGSGYLIQEGDPGRSL